MPKQQLEQQKNWYVIHTYSGYEDAVAKNLKQRIESLGMEDKIFNVIVPKEKKIKIRDGKRRITEEKIYPGYVLVEMVVTDDSWYVVRNTPNVTGFVGAGTTPVPVSQEEIEARYRELKESGEENFPLKEIQERISNELKEKKKTRMLKEWISDLRSNAKIEIDQVLLYKK